MEIGNLNHLEDGNCRVKQRSHLISFGRVKGGLSRTVLRGPERATASAYPVRQMSSAMPCSDEQTPTLNHRDWLAIPDRWRYRSRLPRDGVQGAESVSI